MSYVLRNSFPTEIVDIIKLFTGEGCWRNGKYINIHRIPKNDYRYTMLSKRPIIKQVYNDYKLAPLKGSVWFKRDNGKFIVINSLKADIWNGNQYTSGHFWEMHYNQTQIIYDII